MDGNIGPARGGGGDRSPFVFRLIFWTRLFLLANPMFSSSSSALAFSIADLGAGAPSRNVDVPRPALSTPCTSSVFERGSKEVL